MLKEWYKSKFHQITASGDKVIQLKKTDKPQVFHKYRLHMWKYAQSQKITRQ